LGVSIAGLYSFSLSKTASIFKIEAYSIMASPRNQRTRRVQTQRYEPTDAMLEYRKQRKGLPPQHNFTPRTIRSRTPNPVPPHQPTTNRSASRTSRDSFHETAEDILRGHILGESTTVKQPIKIITKKRIDGILRSSTQLRTKIEEHEFPNEATIGMLARINDSIFRLDALEGNDYHDIDEKEAIEAIALAKKTYEDVNEQFSRLTVPRKFVKSRFSPSHVLIRKEMLEDFQKQLHKIYKQTEKNNHVISKVINSSIKDALTRIDSALATPEDVDIQDDVNIITGKFVYIKNLYDNLLKNGTPVGSQFGGTRKKKKVGSPPF
jgi:hypothetical protein